MPFTPETPNRVVAEYDKDGVRLADDPKALLGLPEGLLALEGLPITFHGAASYPVTQDKVLAAAEHIIAHRAPEQEQQVFHNQAQVMSFASRQFGWHTGNDLSFASVPNYLDVPKDTEEVKQEKAAEIDAVIEMLNSGLLTTREGTRKLFPDMDADVVWDKHETRIAEARESQKRQMKDMLKIIKEERGESSVEPHSEAAEKPATKWEDKARSSKPNPCLGM